MTIPEMRCLRGVVVVLILMAPSRAADEARSPDVTEPPGRDQFLILPLNVHILTAKDRTDIDCRLSDADIARIIGKANGVWSKAGIVFEIASLSREPAERIEEFDAHKAAAARDGGFGPSMGLGVYRTLAPAATRDLPGVHVYYVHELPPNGVYLGANICFIKETASLRAVEGGIDEPIPRVTSHEIGHALGLQHRQDRTNLMASGTTGTILNEREVGRARSVAKKIAGVMTFAECEAAAVEAQKKGDADRAKRLQTAIASVPKRQ